MSVTETTPEQFLEQLPSVSTLRSRLQQHREQGKVLRRLLKLASERDAMAAVKQEAPRVS